MISDEELADLMVERLNSMLKCDPIAVSTLMERWVVCNEELYEHPTVMVGEIPGYDPSWSVSVLGLLNGFVGQISHGPQKGRGRITAVFGDNGVVEYFIRTDRIKREV